jgi:thioredoxin reductase (NADPH)
MSDVEQDNQQFETDVAIIGAGPVGLFAIFQCGMLGLKCHVIDSLSEIGGQCSALYPEKPIYDIPALSEIMAGDLIKNLEKQTAPFKPYYHLNQQAVSICDKDAFKIICTSLGREIKAKAVIIAGGAGSFGPNRPPLEGIEGYEGTSIFYMVRQKEDFRDKKIVIAGGGDSALDWAIVLSDIAQSVSLVHRRDKFRAAPESVNKLRVLQDEGKIDLVVPYQLHSLIGDRRQLKAVRVSGKEGEKEIRADVLLPFYGLSTDLGPIQEWGLDLKGHTIVVNPATSETSQQGVYAVGDIVSYDNKLKLILTGFSEAAMAAHAIYKQINPEQELHFEYSTTKGLPGA